MSYTRVAGLALLATLLPTCSRAVRLQTEFVGLPGLLTATYPPPGPTAMFHVAFATGSTRRFERRPMCNEGAIRLSTACGVPRRRESPAYRHLGGTAAVLADAIDGYWVEAHRGNGRGRGHKGRHRRSSRSRVRCKTAPAHTGEDRRSALVHALVRGFWLSTTPARRGTQRHVSTR